MIPPPVDPHSESHHSESHHSEGHHLATHHAAKPPFKYCPRCAGPLDWRLVEAEGRERFVCRSCDAILYLDPKVAACTIPLVDGRIVLARRAIQPSWGKWVFPGGYMERGETVEEAAIRETREEVNLDVRLERLVGVFSYTDSIVVIVVYAARVTGGELKVNAECLEARLFAPDEIPWGELAFPSTREALQRWLGLTRGIPDPAERA